MATRCEYCLFGENDSADSLRDVLRNFWRALYRRHPDRVRDRANPNGPRTRGFPVFFSPESWLRPAHFLLDEEPELWTSIGSPNRQNLEQTCWDVLREMGRSRANFVVYDFPQAPIFPNDPRYALLVREFKKLQMANEQTSKALQQVQGASAQAPAAAGLAKELSAEHQPIGAFRRIKSEFTRLAAAEPGSRTSS